MLYNKSKCIHQAYKVADVVSLVISMLLATWLFSEQQHYPVAEFIALRLSLGNFLLLAVLLFAYIWILDRFKLYDPAQLTLTPTQELYGLAKAIGFNVLLFAAAGNLLHLYLLSPFFLLALWPITIVVTFGSRRLVHHLLNQANLGDHNRRRMVVVADGETAERFAELFDFEQDMGYGLLGFVNNSGFAPDGTTWLGNHSDLPRMMHRLVIDEVVIALSFNEFTMNIHDIINIAEARGITVRFPLREVFESVVKSEALWRARCNRFIANEKGDSLPELVIASGYEFGWRFIIKRLIDLTVSATLLVLLAPLMLLIALAIKLDSKGPVLFVQKRHGYHGRPFRLYKFRTMVVNAEEMLEELRAKYNEMDGAAFKMKNDPRVTRVGRFLRKSSLDELPQLYNVLRGDMSLVGPRPLSAADYKLITDINHMRRFSVLPGLTCYWQISGRNLLSFEEWMALDLKYVDNFRLLEDLKILLATIPAVLKGKGAE